MQFWPKLTLNFDISSIKPLVALINLFQSLIKSINLSILLIFGQIEFQIYNLLLISPKTFNLCCLGLILNLFIYYYLKIQKLGYETNFNFNYSILKTVWMRFDAIVYCLLLFGLSWLLCCYLFQHASIIVMFLCILCFFTLKLTVCGADGSLKFSFCYGIDLDY